MHLTVVKHSQGNICMSVYKGFNFKCDCPDATKQKRSFFDDTPEIVSDWSSSDSGAQDGECKHVWAIRIILGLVEEGDVPTDYPTPIFEKEETESSKEVWQKGDYKGHSFDWQDTFRIKPFDFYKGG